jgi:hypothetical protein
MFGWGRMASLWFNRRCRVRRLSVQRAVRQRALADEGLHFVGTETGAGAEDLHLRWCREL